MRSVHARVEIAGLTREKKIEATAKSAGFELELPAGPTMLLTTLRRQDGKEHGAYFASIEPVDD